MINIDFVWRSGTWTAELPSVPRLGEDVWLFLAGGRQVHGHVVQVEWKVAPTVNERYRIVVWLDC